MFIIVPRTSVANQEVPMGTEGRQGENLILMASDCLVWLGRADRAGLADHVVKHVEVSSTGETCLVACLTAVSSPALGLVYGKWEHKISFSPFRVGEQSAFAV
jgi:hypothetical protein